MQLQTQRLLLSELTLEDLKDVHQLHSFVEVDQFNTLGIPESIETTGKILNEWLNQQQVNPRLSYTFSLKLVEGNQFVGLMALNIGKPKYKLAEVWFKIHPHFWRQGYTTEALGKLFEFAFNDLKLHRIEAGCAVENIASIKVLEKTGMKREGCKRKVLPIRGEWIDNYFYAILEADFLERIL